MRRTCEKPGCGRPVAVVYGMEEGRDGSRVLWIEAVRADAPDRRDVRGSRCAQHAETLTAPVGWTVDDRRESVPRLFKPKPTLTVVPNEPVVRPRRERTRDLPRPRLFAETIEVADVPEPVMDLVVASVVESEPERIVAPAVDAVVVPVDDATDDLNDDTNDDVIDHVNDDTTDDTTDDATDDGASWVPYFDPDDDLDGVLNATGSMLRDAFRSRHNGRNRDQ